MEASTDEETWNKLREIERISHELAQDLADSGPTAAGWPRAGVELAPRLLRRASEQKHACGSQLLARGGGAHSG